MGKDVKNCRSYLGSGILLVKAIKKYGKKNFVKTIIDYAEDKSDLDRKEKFWISFYRSLNKEMYNIGDGGEGNIGTISDETKTKISDSLKERYKNKKNHPNYGKHLSEETKKKLRKAKLGVNNPNFGKTPSIETIAKLKNYRHTEEAKQKMRRAKALQKSLKFSKMR